MTVPFAQSGSLANTLANRPAPDADKAGRFFLDIDTGQLYRDDGAAWLPVRDALTDRPRIGPLVIQANDANALQVFALTTQEIVEFDQELADPLNMISEWEQLTGVTSANSTDGTLYVEILSTNIEGNPTNYLLIYSDPSRLHLIGQSEVSLYNGYKAITPANGSGLGGRVYLLPYYNGPTLIAAAHWTITPANTPIEIFSVNTLTGEITLAQIKTPSTALVVNLNAERVGGHVAADFAAAGSLAGSTGRLAISIDGGGASPKTGLLLDFPAPYNMTITSWAIYSRLSGSIIIDLWKVAEASYPPTVANTITGSDKPRLAGAESASSSALTGWTKNWTAGDVIGVNIESAAVLQKVLLVLTYTRS